MQTFAPKSRSRSPQGPGDDRAVTEVIGQILVFGILSMVLVLSMLAFDVASTNAKERGALLQAEGIAQQVASVGVEASLFVEGRAAGTTYERSMKFPQDLEGSAYTISISPTTLTDPARVTVIISTSGVRVTAPLLNADAPVNLDICASTVGGGPIHIRYVPNPANACLFLEGI